MNPLANVKNLNKINDREIQLGVVGKSSSWHKQYRHSAWIFFGGVSYELTEGDLLCIFSQYGEIVNINLVRDKKTGKSKGFGFVCYEDQRSTDLAVDNFNGITVLGRILRVDHVSNYKPPKDDENEEDIITNFLRDKGCAPSVIESKLQSIKDKRNGISDRRSPAGKEYRKRSSETNLKNKADDDDDLDVRRPRNYRDNSHKSDHREIKIKKEPKSDDDLDVRRPRKYRDRPYNSNYKEPSRGDIKIKKEPNSDDDLNLKRIRKDKKRDKYRSRSRSSSNRR